MRRKWLILTAALLIAALGGLGWLLMRSHEPVVKGKRLSVWLKDGYTLHFPSSPHLGYLIFVSDPAKNYDPFYDWFGSDSPERQAANDAMRSVGTNAIPTLLRMLRTTDSPFTLKIIELAQDHSLMATRRIPAAGWNYIAANAFLRLGHDAKEAVPAVVEIYARNLSPSSRRASLAVLGNIGPIIDPAARKAVPLLLHDLTNPDYMIRRDAMRALAQVLSESELVVLKLTPLLNDPDPAIRCNAAYDLGTIGARARPAVPALTEALHSPDTQLQEAARKALKQIDPEAGAVNLLTPEAVLK